MSQGQSLLLAVAMHQGQSLSIVSIHIDQMLYDLHRDEVTKYHNEKLQTNQLTRPQCQSSLWKRGRQKRCLLCPFQENMIFFFFFTILQQTFITSMVGPL